MSWLRVGVVGSGALGRHHARIYSQLPSTELIAVADTSPERGRAVAEACGTRWLADYRQLFDQVDAGDVSTTALIRGPDLLAQLIFTPLLATLSIWVGIAVSTRASDPRIAAQLSLLASLPTVAVTSLIAFNVIPATLHVALGLGIVLLVLSRLGWRFATALFNRERLITQVR